MCDAVAQSDRVGGIKSPFMSLMTPIMAVCAWEASAGEYERPNAHRIKEQLSRRENEMKI